MRRREFIGGAAVTWPLSAGAQQSAIPVIGFLDPRSPEGVLNRLRGLREGLKETGYVEGENVTVEYRWAENQVDRVPELAADLVRRQAALIIASGGRAATLAAKAATTSLSSSLPAKTRSGLVSSLVSHVLAEPEGDQLFQYRISDKTRCRIPGSPLKQTKSALGHKGTFVMRDKD